MNMKDKTRGTSERKDKKAKTEEDDSSSDDEDMVILDDLSDVKTKSRQALYWKYTVQYMTALLMIVALFAIMTLVTYGNCLELIQSGIRVEVSLRISHILWRLAYSARMIALNDISTYPSIDVLLPRIRQDMDTHYNLTLALIHGDSYHGLDKCMFAYIYVCVCVCVLAYG